MLNLNWDSPRNSLFDVPKLVIAREKCLYRELAPSEGQSQCRATIPAFVSNFLVFYCSNQWVSLSNFKKTGPRITSGVTVKASYRHGTASCPEAYSPEGDCSWLRDCPHPFSKNS